MVQSRAGSLCPSCGHVEPIAKDPTSATATPTRGLSSQQATSSNGSLAAGPAPAVVPAVSGAEPTTTVIASTKSGQPAPPVSAVEIKGLCKSFGNVKVVDGLTFNVHQGEIFGLLGPNGSGKTTTINMISGLSAQTSGEVQIMGLNVTSNARQVHRMLGFVPQETALYEELSAWRNMEFHADLFGVPRGEKRQRIINLLEMVRLLDRKDSLVRTFSGGMKRRLAIARALLHDPKLVYLDEPTIGVDVQARRAIWDYILNLRDQGKTVLITTNYLEEAQALCDRLAIIDHGKLITLETPDRLKHLYGGKIIDVDTVDPANARNALSNAFDDLTLEQLSHAISIDQYGTLLKITIRGEESLVARVINLLAQKNEIQKISIREPNLDDIFLQLTGSALRD